MLQGHGLQLILVEVGDDRLSQDYGSPKRLGHCNDDVSSIVKVVVLPWPVLNILKSQQIFNKNGVKEKAMLDGKKILRISLLPLAQLHHRDDYLIWCSPSPSSPSLTYLLGCQFGYVNHTIIWPSTCYTHTDWQAKLRGAVIQMDL